MATGDAAHAEFIAIGDALKRLPGDRLEAHGHPAVLLDEATSSSIRVWGWWTRSERPLPCLLWCSERGWFATVVEPEDPEGPGYELSSWSHRIRLFNLALTNAIGPRPSLGLLELDLVLGRHQTRTRQGLIWGIVQLRSAHQRGGHYGPPYRDDGARATPGGRIDHELIVRCLGPATFKKGNGSRGGPPPRNGCLDGEAP